MKDKKRWIMTFKKLPFALILVLILVSAVAACLYCVQLFSRSIPEGVHLFRNAFFSLFFLAATAWLISVALFSRYVYDGKKIRIWFGFLPLKKLPVSNIYGILSYPLNEEVFLLYRQKGKACTLFLFLRYEDADALGRLLTKEHPEIVLEIHTREDEEDE